MCGVATPSAGNGGSAVSLLERCDCIFTSIFFLLLYFRTLKTEVLTTNVRIIIEQDWR